MRTRGLGQRLTTFRAILQQVSNTELCGHIERLRTLVPPNHLLECCGWWDIVWLVELIWYGHGRFSFEAKNWTPPNAGGEPRPMAGAT
jgi:hypothetical protein